MKDSIKLITVALGAGIVASVITQCWDQPREAAMQQVSNSYQEPMAREVFSNNSAYAEEGHVLPKNGFVEASRKSLNSVVYIKTYVQGRAVSSWYEYFMRGGGGSGYQGVGSGSGVIYSTDGFIVTNNHVIEGSDKIEVIHQKRTYEAKVIGTDPSTDLAVLKVEGRGMPNVEIATSRDLPVGAYVLAVGNPFNLTSTVTAGIVSAKGRQIHVNKGSFPLESFIQTDAAINPGNSGGALVDIRGRLVGINSAILSQTGSYAGYGFAVPSDIVTKVVDDLIKYGEVQKAFFGGTVVDVNEKIVKELGLKAYDGVALADVQANGAAKKAGLKVGDIILDIDGLSIDSQAEFEEMISYRSPGDDIRLTYKRAGKIQNTHLELTNIDGKTGIVKKEVYADRELGAAFERVPTVERDMLEIDHGVRVIEIGRGWFRRLGISEGFVITDINGIPIKDPEQLVDMLSKIRGRVIIEGVTANGRRGYYRFYF
ncbi:trypsin-like peptidase domain-containing protein [Persicobacter sp. CCB-QB2]|uniref:trypsin-like peptidase domain-containing protein n=1 Tax=Persicobacter sp. CCB-QB2 TaxID=1561025 RepID=UPI00092F77A9|nr:trypsin-like peptidase domain-containing protein [Persicobacter sp. CCB-QB2]